MLTKNLLRTRSRKGRVYPQFIKTDDAELLMMAEQLIFIFRESVGKNQEQLSEQTASVIDTSGVDVNIGRGLEKLLLDRTEFLEIEKSALVELRDKVFLRTSQALANAEFTDFTTMNQTIATELGLDVATLQNQLYSDLPIYSTVSEFKDVSAESLLHRYNVSTVQGLLLRCSQLTFRVTDGKLTSFRPVFKYLRFFQLLANIKKVGDATFELVIDGPLSLFFQTQKYGLNLANFFPAILHLKNWEIEAEIQDKPGAKVEHLILDNSSGLRSHYQNFSDYVPREIEMFRTLFTQRSAEWSIANADDCFVLGGETYCFPDFVLTHEKNRQNVALEIFHPWHERALIDRLRQLEKGPEIDFPLILGVAKKLLAKAEIAAAIEASSYFKHFGFIFREMPTPEQVLVCLQNIGITKKPALKKRARPAVNNLPSSVF